MYSTSIMNTLTQGTGGYIRSAERGTSPKVLDRRLSTAVCFQILIWYRILKDPSSDASENLIILKTACICPSHPLLFKIGFQKMCEPYCLLCSEGRLVSPEQVWENSLHSTLPDYFYQIKGRQKVGREDSICVFRRMRVLEVIVYQAANNFDLLLKNQDQINFF